MYELAQALSINPQTTEANELYLDVIRLGGPPLILGGAYAELGSYCFHKRDFNQCREYLTRSRELLDPLPFAPEKAALHFHWAQVLRESGEVEAAARECLAGLAQLPDATPSPAVSRLNNCLGLCYWHQGKLDLAEERINLALEHAINAGHTSLHIAAINSLAALLWTRGKVDLALAQVETGIDLARQAMAFQNLKLLLLNACFFHNKLGNPQTARKHATEYLDISRSTGDKFNEAKALMELGNAMEKLQKYADAQSYHERGLAIMIEIGNEQEQAYCHANLGCLHQRAGRWSDALAELDVARDMLLHIDDQYGAGETIRRIAEVHLARGNIDQAEQVANTARTLLEKLQTVEELLWLDIITAQIQVVHGQLAEARDIFVRVIEQSQQLKSAEIEGVALRNLALVYYRLGEFDAAQDAIRRSISMFDLHHNTAELGKSYAAAGLIFSQGRTQPDPSLF